VHGSTHQEDAFRDVRKAKSDGVEMVRDCGPDRDKEKLRC
jgi:hypothetical protein